jgi:peptide-methionine (S)-S-oxide reductase
MDQATFGAGCFWGVEEDFRQLPGVLETAVGYAGGNTQNPTYQDVCSDTTGHAEVVTVTYDPAQVSYEHLLDVFFASHDPTTPNRQGPDVGSQYRSVIFFHNPHQEALALKAKDKRQHSGGYNKPIVTEITPISNFYKAEDYHQQYVQKRRAGGARVV